MSSFRACSGTSSRSFSQRFGTITRVIPAACAASTLLLMPPTGSTRPRSVASPVIAVSLRTFRPEKSEARAVKIVTPADGPSFGTAPWGTWMCTSSRSNVSAGMPSTSAWLRT